MKIYTKTGDDGTTMLFGGGRVKKSNRRIEAYGSVDELNSFIGLLRDQAMAPHYVRVLLGVQERLFALGAHLAANPDKANLKLPDITDADIALLEQEIDNLETTLPPLKNFILPGGNTTVSFCHIARCVCRRTERAVVRLATKEDVAAIIVRYLNRLSDYLFVLGRKLAQDTQAEEIIWQNR